MTACWQYEYGPLTVRARAYPMEVTFIGRTEKVTVTGSYPVFTAHPKRYPAEDLARDVVRELRAAADAIEAALPHRGGAPCSK